MHSSQHHQSTPPSDLNQKSACSSSSSCERLSSSSSSSLSASKSPSPSQYTNPKNQEEGQSLIQNHSTLENLNTLNQFSSQQENPCLGFPSPSNKQQSSQLDKQLPDNSDCHNYYFQTIDELAPFGVIDYNEPFPSQYYYYYNQQDLPELCPLDYEQQNHLSYTFSTQKTNQLSSDLTPAVKLQPESDVHPHYYSSDVKTAITDYTTVTTHDAYLVQLYGYQYSEVTEQQKQQQYEQQKSDNHKYEDHFWNNNLRLERAQQHHEQYFVSNQNGQYDQFGNTLPDHAKPNTNDQREDSFVKSGLYNCEQKSNQFGLPTPDHKQFQKYSKPISKTRKNSKTLECNEDDSADSFLVNTSQYSANSNKLHHSIRKRKRKNNEQLKMLKIEYAKGGFWGKEKISEVSNTTGLSESQVYKWCWDQKKKRLETFKRKLEGGVGSAEDCEDEEEDFEGSQYVIQNSKAISSSPCKVTRNNPETSFGTLTSTTLPLLKHNISKLSNDFTISQLQEKAFQQQVPNTNNHMNPSRGALANITDRVTNKSHQTQQATATKQLHQFNIQSMQQRIAANDQENINPLLPTHFL